MNVSNKNSGIHCTQAHEKCAMEEKRLPHKKICDGKKDFIWLYQKTGVTDFNELQVNNSSHTKGTICLVNE